MIKLTDKRTDEPLWLNPNYISVIRADDTLGTQITMAKPMLTYWVVEDIPTITKRIQEARRSHYC